MARDKNIGFTFLLCLPLLFFFGAYFAINTHGLIPTGFIQYDNVSYIAYAKQYLEGDTFSIFYSNPFNDAAKEPIYFQPHILFFALLLKIGIPPGWILIPFSIIGAFISFRLLIAIYDHLVPSSKNRTFEIWLFAWGGGILCIAGFIACLFLDQPLNLHNLFILDPQSGWWGLNFGRSLFFTCEAYYHALFLGCVYAILKERWLTALIVLFILSLSHPFTGIEIIGIVAAWLLLEYFVHKSYVPFWFSLGVVVVLIFHLYYYLYYLNGYPEHKSVSDQYTLKWGLRYYRMIPAYCLVGLLTLFAIGRSKIKTFFSVRSNRLFACWLIVALALANHDLFITARQPIHFTRGYIWTSLFLLGLPALHVVCQYIKSRFSIVGLVFIGCLFSLDNSLWITNQIVNGSSKPGTKYITSEQKEIFSFLQKQASEKTLLISSDEDLAYLGAVYTNAYPYYSHMYTTPFAAQKQRSLDNFLRSGTPDQSWLQRNAIYILKTSDTIALKALMQHRFDTILNTENYKVFKQTAIN